MTKKHLGMALLLGLLAFNSCQQEEDALNLQCTPVLFSVQDIQDTFANSKWQVVEELVYGQLDSPATGEIWILSDSVTTSTANGGGIQFTFYGQRVVYTNAAPDTIPNTWHIWSDSAQTLMAANVTAPSAAIFVLTTCENEFIYNDRHFIRIE